MADDSSSSACTVATECFVQSLALFKTFYCSAVTKNIVFSRNTAIKYGSSLFGGLLDRCIPSPFAEVFQTHNKTHYDGIAYLRSISNISITSKPTRVCFCKGENKLDCNYHPPSIKVLKGETFNVTLAAVHHVNHAVHADIISFLNSPEGGFGEGQQTQKVNTSCIQT